MVGRLSHDQEQFFYSFRLDEAVPDEPPRQPLTQSSMSRKDFDPIKCAEATALAD
jgi:hypothetical protein